MISMRQASERGHFAHGWLRTYQAFSFGDQPFAQRDGVAVSGEPSIRLTATPTAEILVIELA